VKVRILAIVTLFRYWKVSVEAVYLRRELVKLPV